MGHRLFPGTKFGFTYVRQERHNSFVIHGQKPKTSSYNTTNSPTRDISLRKPNLDGNRDTT